MCQRVNSKVDTAPWFHLGMDFVGPISPLSSKDKRFILTLSDYFTKWVEAMPLPTKESSAWALTKVGWLEHFCMNVLWYSGRMNLI